MTFLKFCAKYFIPFDLIRMFGVWLGKVKDNSLPEKEWIRLWREFYDG